MTLFFVRKDQKGDEGWILTDEHGGNSREFDTLHEVRDFFGTSLTREEAPGVYSLYSFESDINPFEEEESDVKPVTGIKV